MLMSFHLSRHERAVGVKYARSCQSKFKLKLFLASFRKVSPVAANLGLEFCGDQVVINLRVLK